ncbi:S1 family peptidase [Goodfellowiella coeruleoviolacea]|uniref:Peptidase S1 domain-containing protein n=1 Tax=Goodfellowiella coeruleoviolacea TaxID=334858 RepID=A0AAE3KL12_9PSEU|nr:S1 family peptidase [Goodfellowiella coeruleoviolacea]MCP2166028.1 hypothetical protein [Goodfellowiella coeruleoviolacea]
MTNRSEIRRAKIRPAKRRVEDDFLALPGVVGVDIAEKVTSGRRTGRLAIVVSVRAKRSAIELPAAQLIPASVDGVPTDVIEEDIVLHRALLADDGPPGFPACAEVRGAERHRVVVGGISMGPCRAIRLVPPDAPQLGDYVIVGTLGALVTDRTGYGQVMGLTNFHVACVDDAWAVGDQMAHPSRADGGRPGDVVGTLARAALSAGVDGAAVLVDPAWRVESSIVDVGMVAGAATAVVGSAVRKRGRTTALTTGTVSSVDATLSLDFGNGLGVRTLRDQIRVQARPGNRFADHGDSGAAVVDDGNRVVGLYFGGTTTGTAGFANPIAKVLDALDVDLLVAN